MKIIVVGGTGTIGRAVIHALAKHHDIISVGQKMVIYKLTSLRFPQLKKCIKPLENLMH